MRDILEESQGLAVDIRQRLISWFEDHKRDLPFRGIEDPYGVWVSEIMLQQTQVATVVSYWRRWMQRFPTVNDLASADEDDVMRMWAGLGYYRRARLLHEASKLVAQDVIPNSLEGWLALPGVGRYTAGAVTSIALNQPNPVVDGNVSRVFCRVFAEDRPPNTPAVVDAHWKIAEIFVDPVRPGDFNQALMELGATVCTPRNPSCDACPILSLCLAYTEQRQNEIPAPKLRKAPREESRDVHVVLDADQNVRLQRSTERLLGGLLTFGDTPGPEPRYIGDVLHVFSHIRMTYRVHVSRVLEQGASQIDVIWLPTDQIEDSAISVAMRKVWKAVQSDIAP